LSLPYSPELEPRTDPSEGRNTLSEIARITGGIDRTTWDDVFKPVQFRSRQMRDLVLPLAAMLLALHLVEIAGRRLLLFTAVHRWLRSIRPPPLPLPRFRRAAPEPSLSSVDRGDATEVQPRQVDLSKPASAESPLSRAKAKARGRMGG
jgi:hypothetical protein